MWTSEAALPHRPLELDASARTVAWMVERVAAVREAVGPKIDLAIDMHGRYDTPSGIRVARAMEPFKLLWLEEPVPPENVAAMREVKRISPVPLCAGENLYLRWGFRDLLEQQAVDYIMPDIPKCGGLSECRKIANMAEVYYIPLAPHNVCGAARHDGLRACLRQHPNFLVLEWHWVHRPYWATINDRQGRYHQKRLYRLTQPPRHRRRSGLRCGQGPPVSGHDLVRVGA